MKKLTLVVLFALSACATAQKGAPSISVDSLPSGKFSALKPRTLKLEIANSRKINLENNNAKEVEQTVYQTLETYFKREGITLSDSSPNFLKLEIGDYGDFHDDGECVGLKNSLTMPAGKIMGTGFSCTGQKAGAGDAFGGKLAEAYTTALQKMLKNLDTKMGELK